MKNSPDYRGAGLQFPDSFSFGAGTSAYQVEGSAHSDGRGPSIWDAFCRVPGKVRDADTGDVAADHYRRLGNDLDLMKALNLRAYRFSIAWPRIMPTGRGLVNQRGIDFYSRLVDGLIERGISPVATLYHWDLPQALEDEGGWTNRETAFAFAEYAERVGAALGDRVETWATLNAPWCSAYLGYASGIHAPGRTEPLAAFRAVHHLNLAHGLAIQALRRMTSNRPGLSVVLNVHAIRGLGPTGAEAVRRLDALGNRAFTGPMLLGEYPRDLIADTATVTDWSFVDAGDLAAIHQPIDLLGVNYYSPQLVHMREPNDTGKSPYDSRSTTSSWPTAPDVAFVEEPGPYTAMGWPQNPGAFEELLVSLRDQFPGLPISITENGAAFDDAPIDDVIRDVARVDYLRRHVTAVHRAMEVGVDIRSYFVWSLLDNFEWTYGYSKRFGIVYVDYETQRRLPKQSARWYASLAAANRIPDSDLS